MSDGNFKDLFSGRSQDYARFRPTYPPALFAQISSLVADHAAAWDCATGNGQAAVELASRFETVYATDASQEQLDEATPHARVRYSRGSAEASGLASQSVTLVTVAQAFHWFAHAAFFDEVRRVARTGQSVLAIWMYNLARIDERVDRPLDHYYFDVIGRYWEPERRFVDEEYATIPVPFAEIDVPPFAMEARWSLAHLLGYLGTWSATQKARRVLGRDPLAEFAPTLAEAWGADPDAEKTVRWQLTRRFFRV